MDLDTLNYGGLGPHPRGVGGEGGVSYYEVNIKESTGEILRYFLVYATEERAKLLVKPIKTHSRTQGVCRCALF